MRMVSRSRNNGRYTAVDFPLAAGTILTGLNPSGEMAGASCTVASCPATSLHSFTVSKQGVFTGFDPLGAVSSNAASINLSGAVVGAYRDSSGVGHGYLLYRGTFTTIDYPGATFTFAGANNPAGVIVGLWTDTSGKSHSFVLNHGTFTSFDFAGATLTDAARINPSGISVGVYLDSANVSHGFIRTP